jgi:hypothetical protein
MRRHHKAPHGVLIIRRQDFTGRVHHAAATGAKHAIKKKPPAASPGRRNFQALLGCCQLHWTLEAAAAASLQHLIRSDLSSASAIRVAAATPSSLADYLFFNLEQRVLEEEGTQAATGFQSPHRIIVVVAPPSHHRLRPARTHIPHPHSIMLLLLLFLHKLAMKPATNNQCDAKPDSHCVNMCAPLSLSSLQACCSQQTATATQGCLNKVSN